MTDELDLCRGCFLEPRTDGACPRCGYDYDPNAFASALPPGTVLTKYTLGRVLGNPGGFGITYLAFDPVLHRRVAIKELMPRELVARRPDGATLHVHSREDGEMFKQTLASFLKEARLLAQLTHPNVVRVLDYFEGNGTAYFAMEYYEGQTLAEFTQRAGGKLTGSQAVALMLPLLEALEHIHSQPEPILHRDIKPSNIYLTGRHTPILLDFGAARVALGQQSRSLSAVLTPGFAPYEQYSTRGNQGPWSDVYGCAATLHYLVTGRVPPEASGRLDDRTIEPPRTFAPDLSPQLNDAIVYGLGFKPEDRPPTARAFADLIAGRQTAPLLATGFAPPYAPAGASSAAGMTRTVVDPAARGLGPIGATEIAPGTHGLVSPTLLNEPPRVPPLPPAAIPQANRSANRTPIIAAAALVLIAATVGGALLYSNKASDPPEETVVEREPEDTSPPPIAETPPPKTRNAPVVSNPPLETKKAEEAAKVVGKGGGSVAGATREGDPPPPPQPAPLPPPTGVLVIIRGDDPDAVRRAETAILRSIVGRSGLEALDADSLAMLRGDQSAVMAAESGDFAALSAMGRQHGAEVMIVGELRSSAVPSINRFYTGTAELTLRMYRVSTSRLVETQTFIVGQGGAQPVLAASDGEARSRAATGAATAAADAVGSWLGR